MGVVQIEHYAPEYGKKRRPLSPGAGPYPGMPNSSTTVVISSSSSGGRDEKTRRNDLERYIFGSLVGSGLGEVYEETLGTDSCRKRSRGDGDESGNTVSIVNGNRDKSSSKSFGSESAAMRFDICLELALWWRFSGGETKCIWTA